MDLLAQDNFPCAKRPIQPFRLGDDLHVYYLGDVADY